MLIRKFGHIACGIATLLSATLLSSAQAEEYGSLYFYGYLKHFKPGARVHEGGMDNLGVSKELHHGLFQFDTGVSTYVDSYYKRSYAVFTNISHEDFRYGIVTPMLGLVCSYKGVTYDSSERRVYCFPLPKVRIGEKSGLFADVAVLPKFGNDTNGWAAIELGYKW